MPSGSVLQKLTRKQIPKSANSSRRLEGCLVMKILSVRERRSAIKLEEVIPTEALATTTKSSCVATKNKGYRWRFGLNQRPIT